MQHLCAQRLVAHGAQFETLYGGRTNRVWKVLGDDRHKVLKLYRATLRNPMFRNSAGLEAECLQALDTTGFVPRLRAVGRHETDHWVLYDHAPGSPWATDPEPVGRLLRRLHALEVSIPIPNGRNGSAGLASHGQDILDLCESDTRNTLTALRPSRSVPPTHRRCLIHGDPVAGNILVAKSGLTLIDWQCPAIGDPCEDLALFTSPAMQTLYRGHPLSEAEEDRFLSAYGHSETVSRFRTLRPWYSWRMAAYCLWRIENGSPDYAAGLRLEMDRL